MDREAVIVVEGDTVFVSDHELGKQLEKELEKLGIKGTGNVVWCG